MFPGCPHAYITNGVHVVPWTSAPFQVLSDQYLPRWRCDMCMLRYAIGMPPGKIVVGHGSPNVGEAKYACPPRCDSTE
jgi:hypothetical protein